MRKYPQVAILKPFATLVVWFVIAGVITAFHVIWPGIQFAPPASHPAGERWLSDMALLGGVSALVLALVVFLAFRNLQSVIVTLLAGALSVWVSYGLLSLVEIPVSMPLSLLMVFVLVLSATYSIYVGYSYVHQSVHELRNGRTIRDRKFVLSEGVRAIFASVLISAIVTAVGFLCMRAGSVPGIEDMGLLMAIGTLVSAAAALTVVPAVIALWPWEVRPKIERARLRQRLIDKMGGGAVRHPKQTIAIFAAVAAVGLAGFLRVDNDTGAVSFSSLLTIALVTAGVLWLLLSLMFRSLLLGTYALILKAVPFVLMYAVAGIANHALDAVSALICAIVLGVSLANTVHYIRCWKRYVTFERMDASEAAELAIDIMGKPLLVSASLRTLALGALLFIGQNELFWLGLMVVAGSLSALVCDLVLAPAMLGRARLRFPWPTEEQLASAAPMENIVMDPERTKLSDYSAEELEAMHVYDFFSLCGKIVIRVGGLFGTRRLLHEMNIPPGSKVLEIGSGRGATAYTLAKLYDCHVVCTDLSEYMISQARQSAEALGLSDKIDFVVGTDPNRLAFDDNTFDVVLAEAVAMYTTTDVIFKEAYRVLKPGGIFGSHEWAWTDESVTGLRGLVGNIACSSDMYCVNMYTNTGWRDELQRFNFDIEFNEQYPFALTSPMGMFDDEGVWPIMKMFGRVAMHPKAMAKMLRVMAFLDKYAHAFTYSLSVNRKPLS